eukprot:TRINITY_DN1119_c0_g1_i3.p1 TRINITY_DN1119_c0_g1~~TRINITY_DN1119_c0_g1_i3.p1  ORF type:complete len:147 (+),score=46.68 TRINITY_DN1119_c0_g1_i3:260-700(+)
MFASESDSSLVSRTAKGLISKVNLKDLKSYSGTLWKGNPDGEILVEAAEFNDNSLDWIVVIAFEKSDFFDAIEDKMDKAFLIGAGVTAIAVYFTAVMAMARGMERKEEKRDHVSEGLEFFESSRNELLRIYKKNTLRNDKTWRNEI